MRIFLSIVLCFGIFGTSLCFAASEKIKPGKAVLEFKKSGSSTNTPKEDSQLPEDPFEEISEDSVENESEKNSDHDLVSLIRRILLNESVLCGTGFTRTASTFFNKNQLPLYLLFHSWKTFPSEFH